MLLCREWLVRQSVGLKVMIAGGKRQVNRYAQANRFGIDKVQTKKNPALRGFF
ncbi:Uncharacterised protein [Yersinia intermedia]|uniref:Uncharacterized protein n=1 Tax=Yersinia intermedia TaxID=631 RepID=A0A0H5MG88_YERIN|nr:Uncharacterised protein [Yersinia intermedia]